ncbi:glycerophosphodiester phosphodiesterase family protein [Ancylobacter lacus]|uniref:glycerophosphodiester phosphodiesterase family protein n=1 Tax=Ancylobacter lacus TaxID=2579970 RepID=UPI001BCC97FA|nr:glycerophosphodiester phosphodiesterase family protein [Ancylobacter lacus]MBS7541443.1 glycerophosphodiester phosphodiesterase [Ancylobacter lacus]
MEPSPSLDWLLARPIAHRALHDAAAGRIENMPASVDAAVARDYAIEVDVQLTADGEVVVFHDDTLERLTLGTGWVKDHTLHQLRQVAFRQTPERVMTLTDLLERVAGRVPLLIELKSRFDGATQVAANTCTRLAGYRGPVALMSFDPDLVAAVRHMAPHLPRGFTMEQHYEDPEWDFLDHETKFAWAHLRHAPHTRPHFLAHYVREIDSPVVAMARAVSGTPVLAWTVRTADDRQSARRHADQIIFEGFIP